MFDALFQLISSILSNPYGLLFVVIVSLFWYSREKHSYFAKQGIVGPRPLPFFGNNLSMLKTSIADQQLEWGNKYGAIYGIYVGHRPALRIAEPELIKQVLVKDFPKYIDRLNQRANQLTWDYTLFAAQGDMWKRLRALSSPTFSSGKMKKMYSLVQECTDLLVDAIEKIALQSSEIDLKKAFGNLTMDVICSCAFATKTNTHTDSNNVFVKTSTQILNRTILDRLRLIIFFSFPFMAKYGFALFPQDQIDTFEKLILEVVERRRKQKNNDGKKPNDFLQLMLDSRNASLESEKDDSINSIDSAESHHINDHKEASMASSSITKKPLTETELIAQCFIFLIAGFETTATLLSYLFYSLTLNSDCQSKLVEEVNANTNEKGEIDYETLAQMPYLDACISEALRLYSPVTFLSRDAMEDTKLGPLSITKGMAIHIPVFAIHHDEKYYPDPFKFNPDRFLPENRHKLIPYTYLPFGAGPRNCIGLRFALMEAKLATVKVLKRFRFQRHQKTNPIRFKAGAGFLLQCNDLIVRVEKR